MNSRAFSDHATTNPLWREVLQVLTGGHRDYTSVPLKRAVLLLAVPMILEMSTASLFAVVSIFCVSRLGPDAAAAVGLTESVMLLIHSAVGGMSIAATAIVARRIGEKDSEGAAQTVGQIVMLGLATTTAFGLILGFFAVDVLEFMGAEPSVVEVGSGYARLMFSCCGSAYMLLLINATLRGAGDAATAMRALGLASAVGIALVPTFVFGWGVFPEMGVIGAAIAINVGRGSGVAYQIWNLAGQNGRVCLQPRHLRPNPKVLRTVVSRSIHGLGQHLIVSTSSIVLMKIVATFGSAAVAGYTISIRIVALVLLPAYGIANATATLVGQNLGANKADRAEKAARFAVRGCLVLFAFSGAATAVFSTPLVRLFTTDPHVLTHGTWAVLISGIALPFWAASVCLGAAFNGAGDPHTPTRLNFACLWVVQLPLAWLLAHVAGLELLGVFIALAISFATLTFWAGMLFRQGRWKLVRV